MIPDETSPTPIDEHLLAELMACDALLRADPDESDLDPEGSGSTADVDARARSRLLLLLRMLDAAEQTTGGLGEQHAARRLAGSPETRTVLGRFEVLGDLGAGAFGFVVRARDRLLGREVALKMPLPERLLEPEDVRRFLHEARAAARLDHPHIVRVHDAGELGPLGYFIASEFCEGPSLRRWLKSRNEPVSPRLAAGWVAALADAVQHAHERGILHRDIKPDNVILAPGSGEPLPRLTDFGLAKLVEEGGGETRSGTQVGTPHYMAPEQASGRRGEIGPATDVYALGATLYEILIGRPPFRGDSEPETLRLILESEPIALRSLRPGLPRDLETICLKCLRKEPARRYGTAAALRDDLRRYLDGRPILGRPVSARERTLSWARRRPAVAVLVALVFLLACGLIGGVAAWVRWLGWHNRQLRIQVARADRHAQEARKQTRIAEERRRIAEHHDHAEGLRRARQALDARQSELAQDILRDLRPEADADDLRGFAWGYLWRQAHREFSQLWGHAATVVGLAMSPDGKRLATWDWQGKVLIWDLEPGRGPDRPHAVSSVPHHDYSMLLFSPDGRYVAALDRAPSSPRITIIDPDTGRHVARLDLAPAAWVGGLCFDAESRRVAVQIGRSGWEGQVRWWEIADRGHAPHDRIAATRSATGWLSSEARLICVNRDRQVALLDTWTGAVRIELAAGRLDPPGETVFSADGRVAATHAGHCILIWESDSGREVGRCDLEGGLGLVVLSARGARLAVMDDSGYVTVFDRSTRRRHALTSGPRRDVLGRSLSFSTDEALLAIRIHTSSGGPQPTEIWDVATARRLHVFPGRQDVGSVAFIPGRRSMILTGGRKPRIWRLDPPSEPGAPAGHTAEAWTAAFSHDGTVLATGSDDTREPRTIRLWDAASGRGLAGWKGHTATVASLAFSPDGGLLASGSLDSGGAGNANVILWDASSHRSLARLPGHTNRVRSVAFSPDGKMLATASDDLTARLWDVAGRTTRSILSGHTKNLTCVAFSPDGRTLATGSNDATVRLWDVATGRERATLPDGANVNTDAFAPDGSSLASANENGEIKLWGAAGGDLLRTIPSEADQLRCVAFTPDGRNVVAAGKGKVIRIWDVATGLESLTLEGHKAQINALAFSPDGSILASCSHDGAVRLWRAGPILPGPEH